MVAAKNSQFDVVYLFLLGKVERVRSQLSESQVRISFLCQICHAICFGPRYRLVWSKIEQILKPTLLIINKYYYLNRIFFFGVLIMNCMYALENPFRQCWIVKYNWNHEESWNNIQWYESDHQSLQKPDGYDWNWSWKEEAKIQKEVKQTYNLLPLIYNVCVEITIVKWKEKIINGIEIGGEIVNTLRSADDTAVFAES